MAETEFLASTASSAEPIGTLVARHLDRCFRAVMRPPEAEHQSEFMRFVSGTAHPMGNIALIADPRDPDIVHRAAEPLARCGAPAAVIFPHGVPQAAAQAVHGLGFGIEAAMPAMAVDIDRLAPATLPPGYEWARVGAGNEGEAWAEALRVAGRLGYKVGVLQSSTAGHPVYLGLGFVDHARIPMFIRMPA